MLRTVDCLFGVTLAMAGALAAPTLPASAQTTQPAIITVPGAPKIGDPPEASNMRLVGYNDLQHRAAYQPTIHHQATAISPISATTAARPRCPSPSIP